MKGHLLLACATLIFSSFAAVAQAPIIGWSDHFGGSGPDRAKSVRQTPDGGYIMAGTSYSVDGDVEGSFDSQGNIWVVKLSATGNVLWQRILGGSLEDGAESVRPTSDGGYIVVGYTKSIDGDVVGNHGDGSTDDAWVVKLNGAGQVVWKKCLGGTGFDVAHDIFPTTDGGFIVCGANDSNSGDITDNKGGYDFWLVKLSANGTIQWNKSYGGTSSDIARAVRQTADGGYIMCGSTSSHNGDVAGFHAISDMWVVKVSSTGVLEWQNCLGGTQSEVGYAVELTPDGGYVVAGIAGSNNQDVGGNHGGNDAWVVKLNSLGQKQWGRCLGGSGYEIAQAIDVTEIGQVVVAGYTSSFNGDVSGNSGGGDAWVAQLSPSGVLMWQKCLGGSAADWAYGIDSLGNGAFMVCGSAESFDGLLTGNNGGPDYFFVKLDPDPLSVSESNINKIAMAIIHDKLEIRMADTVGSADVRMQTLLGNTVLEYQANQSDTATDVSHLPSGIYLVTVNHGNASTVTKVCIP